MDKRARHLLKMLHYRRRLKNYGLKEADGHNKLRESGKPCSCLSCSPHKYEGTKHADLRRMG